MGESLAVANHFLLSEAERKLVGVVLLDNESVGRSRDKGDRVVSAGIDDLDTVLGPVRASKDQCGCVAKGAHETDGGRVVESSH